MTKFDQLKRVPKQEPVVVGAEAANTNDHYQLAVEHAAEKGKLSELVPAIMQLVGRLGEDEIRTLENNGVEAEFEERRAMRLAS